jgi:hypothetical protein
LHREVAAKENDTVLIPPMSNILGRVEAAQ